MAIVRNEPCPSCRSVGADKTGDHLLIFESGDALCQRCNYLKKASGVILNPGNLKEDVTPESEPKVGFIVTGTGGTTASPNSTKLYNKPAATDAGFLEQIKTMGCVADRGITEKTMRAYGIKQELDIHGSPTRHYYPVTTGGGKDIVSYKCRDCINKNFSLVKATKDLGVIDFFGMRTATKRKGLEVLITEGELDAASAYQILNGHVVDLLVLSIPFGAAAAAKCFSDHIDFLNDQSKVTICFDMDEAGQKASEEVWNILPTIKVMDISEKDANKMLTSLKSAEFLNAYAHAGSFKPKAHASVKSMVTEDVIDPVPWGLSYPWESVNRMTYGIQVNQVIGIGAAPGAGKTTFVRGIQQHLMYHHGVPIGIFSLEEKAEWTTRLLIGYIMNKPIHIPDTIYDPKIAASIKKDLENRAFFYEHKYYTGEWVQIANHIRYLYSLGVRHFFIDPLSALVAHLTPSEANAYLGEAMYDLSKLVQQLDITVFHVNHLNTGADGKSHEAGARVYSSQFTGARAQWRYSHSLFGCERNQLADDGTEDIMSLRFLKDRAFGNTGKVSQLQYNKVTGRLDDVKVTF